MGSKRVYSSYNFNHDILTDAETNDLVIQAQQGDETATEKLVEAHARLVNFAARKYFHPRYDAEDFIQMGMVALLKAIRDFSFEKKVKFSTYVVNKVNGEISTWLRDSSYTMKIPRDISVVMRKIHSRDLLYNTPEEIATALETDDMQCIRTALDIIHKPLLSIDNYIDGKTKEIVMEVEGDANGEWLQSVELQYMLKCLDSRSQKVITLKYWRGLVNKEVALILGVSNAQISRLERMALKKLKDELNKERLIHS